MADSNPIAFFLGVGVSMALWHVAGVALAGTAAETGILNQVTKQCSSAPANNVGGCAAQIFNKAIEDEHSIRDFNDSTTSITFPVGNKSVTLQIERNESCRSVGGPKPEDKSWNCPAKPHFVAASPEKKFAT